MGFDFGNGNDFKSDTDNFDNGFNHSSGVQDGFSGFESGNFGFNPEMPDDSFVPISDISNPSDIKTSSTKRRRKNRFNLSGLPWNGIIVFFIVVVAVAFCVVFQDEITSFLMLLLKWVVIIFVVYIMIRLIFFHRKKR